MYSKICCHNLDFPWQIQVKRKFHKIEESVLQYHIKWHYNWFMSGLNRKFRKSFSYESQVALFRGTSEAVGHFRMKLNIAFPATGCQKLIEVDDERKSSLLREAHGHRSCCRRSGWRMEGLCGPNQWRER